MEVQKLVWPVHDEEAPFTQGFGENAIAYARFAQLGHNGIDIGVRKNTPVRAMASGRVRFASNGVEEKIMGAGAGLCILTAHEGAGGFEFLLGYAHLEKVFVEEGYEARAGEVIALSGNTGASTGDHLHVEYLPLPLELGNGYMGRADLTEWLRG